MFRNMVQCCLTANYPDIPFRVRSSGHYKVAADYQDMVIRREFFELFWCMDGEGQFIINQREYRLRPGEVCFYTPGDTHRVSCGGNFFHYRWMAFDGSTAMALWQGLHLPKIPRQVGCCPEELFIQLYDEILNYSQDGLRLASSTAFRILMLAANRDVPVQTVGDYAEQARKIIDAQYQHSQLNVGWIADQLGVDRSQLSRKFHVAYGVSPVQYLINRRIQNGLRLLETSSLKIREIAARSGFSDANYFSKVIKKYTGSAVHEYR